MRQAISLPKWWFVLLVGAGACASEKPTAQCPPATVIATTAKATPDKPPVPYDLPRTQDFLGAQSMFVVRIQADGSMSLNGQTVASDAILREQAGIAAKADANVRAIIQADEMTPWKNVVHTMDVLKVAGMTKIAFGVTAAAP